MPRWCIEWSGTITRDYGYDELEAPDKDAARELFEERHPLRRIIAVSRIPAPAYLPLRLETEDTE